MDNLIDILKQGDIDLKFTAGGDLPRELTPAEVIDRAIQYGLEHGFDKPTMQRLNARAASVEVLDRVFGPYGLHLLGESGNVVAHTEAGIGTFNTAKDLAVLLLTSRVRLQGNTATQAKVRSASGELMPGVIITRPARTAPGTLKA